MTDNARKFMTHEQGERLLTAVEELAVALEQDPGDVAEYLAVAYETALPYAPQLRALLDIVQGRVG